MEQKDLMATVPIDAIRISPFQPRRTFAKEELKELADSFESVGIIQPPVVRAVKCGEKILYYELIAGERRWRAAQLAKWKEIPVLIKEYNDAAAAQSTLIENVQRVDLDPIEMAFAFKKLIDVFRMTQEEVADQVGKKRSTVANYLRLLSLPQDLQDSVSKGEISMGHAKALLSVDDPLQQEALKRKICTEQLTVRETEKATRDADSPEVHDIEHRLSEHLDTRVKLNHLTNHSGQIVIHYSDLEMLDHLLEKLGVGSEASSCFV